MRTEHSYIQFRARTYDPEIGRFMSVDPLFEMFPEHSPYQYAYNSPLIWSDPSGMFSQTMYEVGNDGNIWEVVYEVTIKHRDSNPLMPGEDFFNFHFKSSRRLGAGSGGGGSSGGGAGSFWDNPISGSWTSPGDGNNVVLFGGGGGGGGPDPRGGVKANDETAKNGIKKSVENYYEKYISFDEEGYVEITEEGVNKALSDKESNLYKLYILETKSFETIFVTSIDYYKDKIEFVSETKTYSWETKKYLTGTLTLTYTLNEFVKHEIDYTGHTFVSGVFLASKYGGGDLYRSNIKNSSGDYLTNIFMRDDLTNDIGGYYAHELYFHAYLFVLGYDNWGCSGRKVKQTKEFIKGN